MIAVEAEKQSSTVLIVDDHPSVREALKTRIANHPDLEICGEAASVPDALRLVNEKNPDIIIIDISLKDGDGIDLIKRIKAHNENARMLVWSMHSDSIYGERALNAGALGYINKEQATDQIIDAIRQVLAGKLVVSPAMNECLLKRIVGGRRVDTSDSILQSLSDRELQVFRLIGQAKRTQEIADLLHLSVKTIETHRDRIRKKLGLRDSAELVYRAVQWVLENQ